MKKQITEIATPPSLALAPKPKTRLVPKRIKDAIAAMVAGEVRTVTQAAEKVGCTREYLSRSLSRPDIAEYLRNKAGRTIAVAAARAAAVKVDLLDCESSHVRNDASTFVLETAGIRPARDPQVNFNLSVSAGFVIDLSEPDDPINITPIKPTNNSAR